ncbi:MAG: tyrosine-type recombinase/integrase [Pseudomonadota bacterium]
MFTKDRPRKEIPLGPDFILALRKYSELNVVDVPLQIVKFSDVLANYITKEIPKLAENTRRTYLAAIKHLAASFNDAPLDQIRAVHIRQFLDDHSDTPTTANRCKRVFSTIWNKAREWDYTTISNPCLGVRGHAVGKRDVYITDTIFKAVWQHGDAPLRDAMDLAYLTGQRPADALQMSVRDIESGYLKVKQDKTRKRLRIEIIGELKNLLERIESRKAEHNIVTDALLVNLHGKRLTVPALRYQFDKARKLAKVALPEAEDDLSEFIFYDLRAKAADDTKDQRGEQAATDLLGHDSVKTTQRHYFRNGKKVQPTK